MTGERRGAVWIACLLVAAAALFAVGSAIEQSGDDHGTTMEAGERGQSGSETGDGEAGEETVLGLDLESPALVALGVVASLGLALLVWRWPRRSVLFAVAGFASAFAVLDLVEGMEKLEADSTGLAVLAGAVAAAHLAAAWLAGRMALSRA